MATEIYGRMQLEFARVATAAEATKRLMAAEGVARVLAGGTDLLVQMKSGFLAPDTVIDIKKIPGIASIQEEDGGIRVGAAVPAMALGEHEALARTWPGVVEAAQLIGSAQIQGRCTMGGNLCNASPAADSVPALAAADATARIEGPEGPRDCPVLEVPAGPGQTALKTGEFVSSFFLPARPPRAADAYLRFIPRTEMDIAVASAGVSLALNENGEVLSARVALGAVAPTVIMVPEAAKAIIGSKIDDGALERMASLCESACAPIDDKRGTVEFRTRVAGVLARRAAGIAYSRAGGAA